MKSNHYIPKPLDTSNIAFPEQLTALIEVIAKNVHETWAQQRFAEGWVYGPKRSDDLKTHPCLVPYDQLPDEEKNYDRNTALNTLKTIIRLGFSIMPPHNESDNGLQGKT
ncbi:MAG: Ryanodine receptor Ryr [Muribaculaceae bacterium]|nr:Ryanodine receptor Ryr [Muribaculaceae bacterium]MBQ3960289.1 Ryanodine receptor Ryr [Muribaculaceae bacterium]